MPSRDRSESGKTLGKLCRRSSVIGAQKEKGRYGTYLERVCEVRGASDVDENVLTSILVLTFLLFTSRGCL